MYMAKELTEYSTPSIFLNKLKEFLIGTGIFTLVEEDFEAPVYVYFKLQYKNTVIKIQRSGSANRLYCDFYLLVNGNEVQKTNTSLPMGQDSEEGKEATRNLKILLINNKNNLVFKIGGFNSLLLSNAGTVRMIVTDNNLYSFVNSDTTSANAVNSLDESYTYRPYHPYSKSQTELFLDPELPWTKVSDGSFYSNSIGITGLGGAECGKLYQLTNGTKYYAIFNNMAIEMGEEVNCESIGT